PSTLSIVISTASGGSSPDTTRVNITDPEDGLGKGASINTDGSRCTRKVIEYGSNPAGLPAASSKETLKRYSPSGRSVGVKRTRKSDVAVADDHCTSSRLKYTEGSSSQEPVGHGYSRNILIPVVSDLS